MSQDLAKFYYFHVKIQHLEKKRKSEHKRWRFSLQGISMHVNVSITWEKRVEKYEITKKLYYYFFFGGEQILPGGWIQCQNIELLIVIKLKTDSWSNSYREKMNIWDYNYLVTE